MDGALRIALSVAALAWALLGAISPATADMRAAPPHLSSDGGVRQLVVDGAPFLILGGELGNSSATSIADMDAYWPDLVDLRLNTILAPVYWELIEPTEGAFDFSLVDALIARARKHDQRLVLLWFASWKNSMSSYAPGWVKADTERFPRAITSRGAPLEMLSAFNSANLEADRRAFVALMRYLARVDGRRRTVIMVQVENEIGMLEDAREHGPDAQAAFAGPVPAPILDLLIRDESSAAEPLRAAWAASGRRQSGAWGEVFGDDLRGHEIFMAWSYARYVEEIAAAGKAVHDIPLFVNAALPRPGRKPGDYPSAGPLPHLRDLWRLGAPSIDFIAPDIYFPNFVEWARKYAFDGNPLFIPEAGRAGSADAPGNALFAIGELHAIGFSPFWIENIDTPEKSAILKDVYEALRELTPLIIAHQGKSSMRAVRAPVSFEGAADLSPQSLAFGDFILEATVVDPWTPRDAQHPENHAAIVFQLAHNEFLVAGVGVTFTFKTADAAAGILAADEGYFRDGQWRRSRRLNGDQTHQGRHVRLPPGPLTMQRVTLYRY